MMMPDKNKMADSTTDGASITSWKQRMSVSGSVSLFCVKCLKTLALPWSNIDDVVTSTYGMYY